MVAPSPVGTCFGGGTTPVKRTTPRTAPALSWPGAAAARRPRQTTTHGPRRMTRSSVPGPAVRAAVTLRLAGAGPVGRVGPGRARPRDERLQPADERLRLVHAQVRVRPDQPRLHARHAALRP